MSTYAAFRIRQQATSGVQRPAIAIPLLSRSVIRRAIVLLQPKAGA